MPKKIHAFMYVNIPNVNQKSVRIGPKVIHFRNHFSAKMTAQWTRNVTKINGQNGYTACILRIFPLFNNNNSEKRTSLTVFGEHREGRICHLITYFEFHNRIAIPLIRCSIQRFDKECTAHMSGSTSIYQANSCSILSVHHNCNSYMREYSTKNNNNNGRNKPQIVFQLNSLI